MVAPVFSRTLQAASIAATIAVACAVLSSCVIGSHGRQEGAVKSSEPHQCLTSEVERTVTSYFRDLSDGRIGQALARIAQSDRFNWYSVDTRPYPGSRIGVDARSYNGLSRYLNARQSHGEKWKLHDFRYYGERKGEQVGNFGLSLIRVAADTDGKTQMMHGKGAVDCRSGNIMVMSLDTNQS